MGYVPRFIPVTDVSLVYPTGLYPGLDLVFIFLVYPTGHVPRSIPGIDISLVYPTGHILRSINPWSIPRDMYPGLSMGYMYPCFYFV